MKKSVFVLMALALNLGAFAMGRFSPLGVSIVTSKSSGSDAQLPEKYDYVYGVRLSLLSGAHRRMVGLATAVCANYDDVADGTVGGLQIAGLFNTAGDGELGVGQISGFFNGVSRNCNGVQICSVYNKAAGYFSGCQVALFNGAKSDCAGAQIGLFNRGGSVMGLQIGLLNFAESLQGMQLGVLNFVDSSMMSMFPVVRIGW